ncbi:hypothetical protein E4T56_gene18416 [Termitomyces sp. T112]|nr:hypothetical protein E4T56_gene18416 [Termitomyces sp. T112]
MTCHQGCSQRQSNNDARVAPTPQHKITTCSRPRPYAGICPSNRDHILGAPRSKPHTNYPLWSTQKQATCEVISQSTLKVADAFSKKRAVPLPTATPAFATISGLLWSTNKELPQPCRNSQGVPLQCLPATDFPATPPNNREQPTNPHRVTLVSTPGPPTSSPMEEPPNPRPPNSREYQKYIRPLCPSRGLPLELVGTDHPAPCPLGHRHSGAHQSTTQTCPPTDAILWNTTPTQTNYAARTNLTPLTPTNEEGPATFATSADIRARSWEDLCPPPANRTAKKTKAPNPLDTRERFEGPPSDTNTAHVPAADQENPYTLAPPNSTGELPPPPPDPGSPPCDAPPHPDKPRD